MLMELLVNLGENILINEWKDECNDAMLNCALRKNIVYLSQLWRCF